MKFDSQQIASLIITSKKIIYRKITPRTIAIQIIAIIIIFPNLFKFMISFFHVFIFNEEKMILLGSSWVLRPWKYNGSHFGTLEVMQVVLRPWKYNASRFENLKVQWKSV